MFNLFKYIKKWKEKRKAKNLKEMTYNWQGITEMLVRSIKIRDVEENFLNDYYKTFDKILKFSLEKDEEFFINSGYDRQEFISIMIRIYSYFLRTASKDCVNGEYWTWYKNPAIDKHCQLKEKYPSLLSGLNWS